MAESYILTADETNDLRYLLDYTIPIHTLKVPIQWDFAQSIAKL